MLVTISDPCVTIPWRQLGVPADVCTMVSRSSMPWPSNMASAAQLPSVPLTSHPGHPDIHSQYLTVPGLPPPPPLPSPCCQKHVLQRAVGKVGFWGKRRGGKSWRRRVQLGWVVQPPSRSWGDLSHKEMSLILLPPDDIPEQSQAVSPGLFVTITGRGAKTGKGIPKEAHLSLPATQGSSSLPFNSHLISGQYKDALY